MSGLRGPSEIAGLVARARSLWRGISRRADVEADMRDEFRHHLALRTEHLMREGHSAEDAARRARVEFGHVDSHAQDARASRGLRHFDRLRFSWLDVKLGGRMLVRYPGLTAVAGLAMAFAIAVGAATFEAVNLVLHPTLPLPQGDRLVGIAYWDRERNEQTFPDPVDFRGWQSTLRTIEDLNGFRIVSRNLFAPDGISQPVEVAEVTAATFRALRLPARLGRTLIDADGEPGAPPVVVIGHRLWQQRFASHEGIVGQRMRVGSVQATIVGVMPEGFAFPYDHDLWTPLRLGAPTAAPGREQPVRVFGRLAAGATIEQARAEAGALAARVAADFPDRYEHLSVQVLPYALSIIWITPVRTIRAGIYSINGFAALLLLLVCGNVALLMFARAATREREILVRNALGATRARIMTQLFAEALVLGSLAAVVGLVAAGLGLRLLEHNLRNGSDDPWPFWFTSGLSPSTLLYTALLTLLAAGVAGVVPALKVTGRGMEARLRQANAGSGLRMGGLWTAMIIAQIASTVLFTACAYVLHRQATAIASVQPAFPASEYLAARVEMGSTEFLDAAPVSDATRATESAQLSAMARELERRLRAEPAVLGVTVAAQLPLMPQPPALFEVEGLVRTEADGPRPLARTAAVSANFFDVFKAPVLAGRTFSSGDLQSGAQTVMVNQLFVDRMLGGRNPIGRRIRYFRREDTRLPAEKAAQEPWLEIVGVVRDLVPDVETPFNSDSPSNPQVYRPLGRELEGELHLAAHLRGDPAAFTPTLRRIAAEISPELRLGDIQPLDQATSGDARGWRLMASVILLASAIALILSLAGIYSIMSFTVSRRTREIGVRVALGGETRRVVFEILRRPLAHVAIGVTVGWVLVSGLVIRSGSARGSVLALLFAYAAAMIGVCALACIGPMLRALRVPPTVALSAEV